MEPHSVESASSWRRFWPWLSVLPLGGALFDFILGYWMSGAALIALAGMNLVLIEPPVIRLPKLARFSIYLVCFATLLAHLVRGLMEMAARR